MRVAERMRREPVAVGPGEGLGLAGRLLARHRVDALPVVRRTALVGLLAAVDVDRAHPSVARARSRSEKSPPVSTASGSIASSSRPSPRSDGALRSSTRSA
jgi:CBS domain-containing protein